MKARYRFAVVAVIAAALVGCDPYPVPTEPDHADLYIEYNSTGGASAMVILGGHTWTSVQLAGAGETIAPALFDHHVQQTVRVDEQKALSGYPFIRISAANAYVVSPHPLIDVDTGAALSLLSHMGYRSVDVDISAPHNSDTAVWETPPDIAEPGQWSWNGVVPGQSAPAGDITILPPPAYHAPPRDFAQAGWIAGSMVFITAAAFLVTGWTARRRRRSTPSFNPSPGWPAPPRGWTPPAGWRPDPNWPDAPSGWQFFRKS